MDFVWLQRSGLAPLRGRMAVAVTAAAVMVAVMAVVMVAASTAVAASMAVAASTVDLVALRIWAGTAGCRIWVDIIQEASVGAESTEPPR